MTEHLIVIIALGSLFVGMAIALTLIIRIANQIPEVIPSSMDFSLFLEHFKKEPL